MEVLFRSQNRSLIRSRCNAAAVDLSVGPTPTVEDLSCRRELLTETSGVVIFEASPMITEDSSAFAVREDIAQRFPRGVGQEVVEILR